MHARTRRVEPAECHRCGYLGWASPIDLSETSRRAIRELPPEERGRRLRVL
jgi:hypothetical protein